MLMDTIYLNLIFLQIIRIAHQLLHIIQMMVLQDLTQIYINVVKFVYHY